jgi:hypothetical protein
MKKRKVNKAKLFIGIILAIVFISVGLVSVSFRMRGDHATADSIFTWLFMTYAGGYMIQTLYLLNQ